MTRKENIAIPHAYKELRSWRILINPEVRYDSGNSLDPILSFQRIGTLGRLGNQMFQYAFLRTMAGRLGVKFFCPRWIGDDIFLLNDERERATSPESIRHSYNEPWKNFGYCEDAMHIRDRTELCGYFQSERYYSDEERHSIRQWFTFKPETVARAQEAYASIDFDQATAVHVRFGDYHKSHLHVSPSIEYYVEALSIVRRRKHILVFSDDIAMAQSFLHPIELPSMRCIRDTTVAEDLFLMTRCSDHICAASSFSWWGAWLSKDGGVTCAPKEWMQLGSGFSPESIPCEHWHMLRATSPNALDVSLSFVAGFNNRAKRTIKSMCSYHTENIR